MLPEDEQINAVRKLFVKPAASAYGAVSDNLFWMIAIPVIGILDVLAGGLNDEQHQTAHYIFFGILFLLVRDNIRSMKAKLPYFKYIDFQSRIQQYRQANELVGSPSDASVLERASRDDRNLLASMTGIPVIVIAFAIGGVLLWFMVDIGIEFGTAVWRGGPLPYDASYGSAYFQIGMSFAFSIAVVVALGLGTIHSHRTWRRLTRTLRGIYVPQPS
jgi:hypothetical protein